MNASSNIPFNNSYVRLPPHFYAPQPPTPVAAPRLIRINRPLAELLGIDATWLESEEGIQVLAGNRVPEGAEPIATAYAGHQFGGWNPQLGDGRAILLGEVIGRDGHRYDIQLKGSGRTLYSRGGDGRSPLGPVLREYIVSEAMAVLGVPTTRSLAAVASGERVARDRMLPGGVLTRVASSHIRIGTIQFFSARQDIDAVRQLADHIISRHFSSGVATGASFGGNPAVAAGASFGASSAVAAGVVNGDAAANRYLALLQAVIARQASLIAQWQQLGFIHGVMNTDNMLLCGETIDYGPCAFIDDFHPAKVFSSIDTRGRYAWHNQPAIAQWNLSWLAQALMPLLADDQQLALQQAQQAIEDFVPLYQQAWQRGMLAKLGLSYNSDDPDRREKDIALIDALLLVMAESSADFTLTFRRLAELADASHLAEGCYQLPAAFAPWLEHWRARLALEPTSPAELQKRMLSINPLYIPRNHQIEAAIRAAEDRDDFAPFHRLVERLARPFDDDPNDRQYALPPQPEEVVLRTFCGT